MKFKYRKRRKCPYCQRMIQENALGAVDSIGDVVMEFHLTPGTVLPQMCAGTARSPKACKKLIAERNTYDSK